MRKNMQLGPQHRKWGSLMLLQTDLGHRSGGRLMGMVFTQAQVVLSVQCLTFKVNSVWEVQELELSTLISSLCRVMQGKLEVELNGTVKLVELSVQLHTSEHFGRRSQSLWFLEIWNMGPQIPSCCALPKWSKPYILLCYMYIKKPPASS